MNLQPVLYVIGILLSILALSMTLPMLVDLHAGHSDWRVFFICILITSFFGGMLILTNASDLIKINTRQGFLLTTLSWVSISLFGALPLWLSELDLSFTDAVFESVSGITTTGGTVITGLNEAPPGLLLWRAILQWLGGIGFIVMAISLLPFLNIGGMQLFRTESSERSEKALPRAAQVAENILKIYIVLTAACTIGYLLTGFGMFDAVCHAMATIATGGFSNYDTSFINNEHVGLEIVATIFMLLGSLPFILYFKSINNDPTLLFKDQQVRGYMAFLAVTIGALSLWMVIQEGWNLGEALRYVSFNVVSVVTTTGFASHDYTTWGLFPLSVFFFLMFMGGCTGSTTGGIKFFRFEIAYLITMGQLKKLISPNAVITPIYNGKPIPYDVLISILGFFFIYAISFALLSIGLSFTGLDYMSAMSSSVAALSNVGPGLGPITGPLGNFAGMTDTAKWLMSFGMLLGRLELFTVLVLFYSRFWKP